ncbi:hypothetical protein HPP92_007518 [Vanilla planifolia]|uniref:Uncharacterized protein n=1 Tax=Vanilla planifolia TaxID=51239 RepID=A0A835VAB0_VANPL|nr:hypothetical protein HPP92_007687 [Vanilla planifolia]KAG0490655.1 hypothetical protein HPP92_007518 [Vanilla planifolia]
METFGRGSDMTIKRREKDEVSRRLQYNQAKERSESGNMDKGNGKSKEGDTQQELAQTLVSFFEIYRRHQ